jgi:hypothetical protein
VAEDDDGLRSVTPPAESEDDLIGTAADEDDVDAGIELLEAVGFLFAGFEEVEAVVKAGEKAIDADAAKDGELHTGLRDEGAGYGRGVGLKV